MSYLFNNYAPLNLYFNKGRGCWLFDNNNNKYLDAISGMGVVSLGHSHPQITKIIHKQSKLLLHTSNIYHIDNQIKLAEKLAKLAAMDKVFFANSGAEANEAAIKLTRLYAKQKNIANPVILSAKNSFHGRTMATLSASGNNKIKQGFSPQLAEFIHIDFNNISSIYQQKENENIVAIMLEPILGEDGVIIPCKNYLNDVAKIAKEQNWLLVLDEVQTGIGRTGQMFCHNYNGITPDILTLAKGLGNGLPIGACVGGNKVAKLFTPGSHGSTFGGNPLSTAVALGVLNTINNENIMGNVNTMSQYFLYQAKKLLKNITIVKDIRAKGLMLGISLDKKYPNLVYDALKLKILINVSGINIRLLPPLIINKKEMNFLLKNLYKLLHNIN